MDDDDDDAVTNLQIMFCEDGWDEATLREILRSNGGVEAAIDEILAAESPANWMMQRVGLGYVEPPPPKHHHQHHHHHHHHKFVTVVVPRMRDANNVLQVTEDGRNYAVSVPEGLKPGERFVARLPDYQADQQAVDNPLISASSSSSSPS